MKLSRTPQIDREKIIEKVGGSQYELNLMAVALARKNRRDGVDAPGGVIDALLEIQNGKKT